MVAPQGDHGASECEAGVGLWDLNGVNDVRAPLVVSAPFALHACIPGDGLGVSEIGHFQTVNRIFGQHFSKNTASVRAFIYQFCPKESLWDNISHLDCGFCWVMGISCSIANDNVKLVFWV